tara:strand:+ start:95 stop:760 length:666 start_codon:yes stop_codon:yes gene_type:complete
MIYKEILKLEKLINLKFSNHQLLIRSMTHKSYNNLVNNEKLEFLGDRVLGLVISKRLLEIFPNEKEGVLDKKLASLVNKNKCFKIAKSLNLEKYILIANNKNIKIADKIVSDCCEALIGSIFLDKGLEIVEKFILKLWNDDLKASIITFVDSKTQLQEFSLKKFKRLPIYKVLENTGPRHKPIFKVAVKLENSKFVTASGNSKKDAEQMAAKLFLKNLGKK